MDGTETILGTGISITMIIAFIVVGLLVGTFFLWLALKLLGIPEEKMEFFQVFLTQLINVFVGLVPIIGCILQWYIIKIRHTDSWGLAIAAWILSSIIPAAITYGILFALGLGTSAFAGPTPTP